MKLVSQDQEVKLDLKDPRVEMDPEVSKDRGVIGGYRVLEVKRANGDQPVKRAKKVTEALRDLKVKEE